MGEGLLRAHVEELRARLAALPAASARLQRLDLEDNVVEFKVVIDDDPLSGKRLNFLIYEADSYPDSGGVMMSEDEQDEALVEAINARLGEPEGVSVGQALRVACLALGVEDPVLLACLDLGGGGAVGSRALRSGGRAASPGGSPVAALARAGGDAEIGGVDGEADLAFEGEDEDGPTAGLSMYIGAVADRENRPGWKKLKWQETEDQRVARRKEQQRRADHEPGQKRRKGGGGEMTLEEQKAADEQMWSSQEAFTILSNELYCLQTEGDATLEADAANYDVHQWTVRLAGCSGPLGGDLSELKSRFGYDYIEIHLSFKEDLHPFYPPTASIIRPRLHGRHDILAALACHPRLQLRGWSPFQTTKDLLMSIRRFFESTARVDLDNEQNDLAKFPGGAFSRLERLLAQLGSLCEIVPTELRPEHPANPYKDDPWAQHDALTQSSLGAMLARRKGRGQAAGGELQPQRPQEPQLQDRGVPKAGSFWAAGTGYGHDAGPCVMGGGGTWDPQAMRAAEVAQDEELKQLVGSITAGLRSGTSGGSTSSSSSAFTAARGDEDRARALAELLAKSCLPPFLVRELSISYTNMGDRLPFFEEVYRLVQELLRAVPDHVGPLLGLARPHLLAAKASGQTFLQSLGSSAGRADLSEDVAFARLAVQTADEVERLCELKGLGPPPSLECGGSSSSSAIPGDASREADYCRRLRPLQLDHAEFGGGPSSHSYASQADGEGVAPQARTVRLAKELAGLASLLPLSGSSSVFVRASARQQQLWRALVTGPDDTPYSGGCFIFDMYFPPQYPNEPPRVKLLTTGNNSVTFNPNLYETGKVCLSLLGTWKGEKAESWDPTSSRMLQVLVSIQSLILVPEPYFNEPGYEREIGTKLGETRSWEYNVSVRENCVRWAMLDAMRNPPAEFREVIHEHFRVRGAKIKEMVQGWVADAERKGASHRKHSLNSLLSMLGPELDRLQARAAAAPRGAEACVRPG